MGLDQTVAQQVQPKVGILGALGSGIEIDDHTKQLCHDLAQTVIVLCLRQ